MKLSLEMSNKDIYDPGSSKKGRLFLLLFPFIFIAIFVINTWDSWRKEPSFYIFVIYALSLGLLISKYWENYYSFAKLYRKKINPDFPLTRSEYFELWVKDNKYRFNQLSFLTITFDHFTDNEISKYSKKANMYLVLAFCSPVLFFALTLAGTFLFRF